MASSHIGPSSLPSCPGQSLRARWLPLCRCSIHLHSWFVGWPFGSTVLLVVEPVQGTRTSYQQLPKALKVQERLSLCYHFYYCLSTSVNDCLLAEIPGLAGNSFLHEGTSDDE